MSKFKKGDRVLGNDGYVGTVVDPNYLGCAVLVRYPGGVATNSEWELTLIQPA
ncbi:hypothetical protein [Gordoniibacillus kamchatkensis]|uniref:hypothetical protein n=1 Tax=Gordoniibacillus kamchatkensis TaxID=1590651 RepID=UPI0012E0918A|nr:hypothetical protein [Paenibacillus sp. VKM B-2647]